MSVKTNIATLISKIQSMFRSVRPEDPRMRRLLERIGMNLESEIKTTITRKRIVDSNFLRESIKYRVDGNAVTVGSFGVRYAKFHEFGATLSPAAVRAMFANMRRRSKKKRKGKGVFRGNPKTGGVLMARPFVRPSVEKLRPKIYDLIRAHLRGE